MSAVNIDALSSDTFDSAFEKCVASTFAEAATNEGIGSMSAATRWCREAIEETIGAELDAESADEVEFLAGREIRGNYGHYTTPDIAQHLREEYAEGLRSATASTRWREIVDMLAENGYLANISLADILEEREWNHYANGTIKANGLSIGWNTNLAAGIVARIGIDSDWNKVRDAAIKLYWPGIDDIGTRQWEDLKTRLENALDPKAKTHKDFVAHRDRVFDDISYDMTPIYGKDA